MMERRFFTSNGIELSYVLFDGPPERTLVALHGHFGTGSMFAKLGKELPNWRVIALDQRGHGWSAHVPKTEYNRTHYIQDIYELIHNELGGMPVVLLGHSLGGVNAYQFAARYPELVKGLIIEDIGTKIEDDQTWVKKVPDRSPTVRDLQLSLESIIGKGAFPYFAESLNEDKDGWFFRFDAEGIIHSQMMLNGEWWSDWLATSCPLLLMQGEESHILNWELAEEMKERRVNTVLKQFPKCGHTIRNGDPENYIKTIKDFLEANFSFN